MRGCDNKKSGRPRESAESASCLCSHTHRQEEPIRRSQFLQLQHLDALPVTGTNTSRLRRSLSVPWMSSDGRSLSAITTGCAALESNQAVFFKYDVTATRLSRSFNSCRDDILVLLFLLLLGANMKMKTMPRWSNTSSRLARGSPCFSLSHIQRANHLSSSLR